MTVGPESRLSGRDGRGPERRVAQPPASPNASRPSRRATCKRLPGGEGQDEGGLLFPSPSSGLRQIALRSPAAERRPKLARIFKCGFERTQAIRPTGRPNGFRGIHHAPKGPSTVPLGRNRLPRPKPAFKNAGYFHRFLWNQMGANTIGALKTRTTLAYNGLRNRHPSAAGAASLDFQYLASPHLALPKRHSSGASRGYGNGALVLRLLVTLSIDSFLTGRPTAYSLWR